MLQEIVRSKLDLLVSPFRGAVDAGDEGCPVHPAEIADHERISSFRLLSDTSGEAEMPGGVLLPGMPFQKGVLGIRARLHFTPVAVEHVLLGVDQPAAVAHRGFIQRVLRHAVPPFRLPLKR
jgi:hypothetical protein